MQLARRVVVTGLGAVSPVGNTAGSSWQAVTEGRSGVGLNTDFDTTDFATKIAALVKDFEPGDAVDAKSRRRLDVFLHYAMVAALESVADSGLEITDLLAPRVGVAIGSGVGGLPLIESQSLLLARSGPRKVSPFFIPGSIVNMASGWVAERLNCQGPNVSMVSACASGAHSIGYAARSIAYGDADVMIAGGAEKASCPVGIAGFNAVRALSTRNDDPAAASRPWDKDRDGFVLGDGAGILVLEELDHAKARGATIYAELTGFGMSGDAYHMTAAEPNGRGMVSCMRLALNDAGLSPEAVGYVNAHGTSTPLADPIELNAVKQVFGAHAYDLLMSSTKSMTGHLLGAAGALEAIFSVLSLRDQLAPPTLNLDHPDEGCDLQLVPHEARSHQFTSVLSNSFGFGGTNASLVFSLLK